jgi:hypothetical protein
MPPKKNEQDQIEEQVDAALDTEQAEARNLDTSTDETIANMSKTELHQAGFQADAVTREDDPEEDEAE